MGLKVVFGEIRVHPNPHLTILIEPNQSVIDLKSPQVAVELMETQKRLAKHIQPLLMCEIACLNESEGDILDEDQNVFVVRTDVTAGLVVRPVGLDNRFIGVAAIQISTDFFLLVQPGIIEQDVLFCQNSELVLVDLMPFVSVQVGPVGFGERGLVTSH